MLICMNCNVEYEEGRKFCKYCGEPLAPKIEPISTQKKGEGTGEGKADGKLICPDCKIIYEFGNSCIQCGSILVPNIPSGEKEELRGDRKETTGEKGSLQGQTSPEEQIKKPLQNLICPHCKINYEHGNFCIKCASALIPQYSPQTNEDPKGDDKTDGVEQPTPLKTIHESMGETSRKKLICPTCKIIYERGDSCIRCGGTLVPQFPSQEGEKSKLPEPPPIDAELPSHPSPPEKGFGEVEQVKNKDIEVLSTPEFEMKKEPPLTETPEQQPTARSTDDLERRLSFSKKRKIDYRRLSLEVGSLTIMAVAGGYFFWSVFSHMNKETGAKTTRAKEIPSSVLIVPSKTTPAKTTASVPKEIGKRETEVVPSPLSNPTPSDGVFSETLEIDRIKKLLENIRQANLKKNIDLFLSCYSSDFKDREVKKKATLDNWKKFDYLDLSYDLKTFSLSENIAKAKVEWLIKIYPTAGGKPQENKTILDVILKKEEGDWRIKEVKLAG